MKHNPLSCSSILAIAALLGACSTVSDEYEKRNGAFEGDLDVLVNSGDDDAKLRQISRYEIQENDDENDATEFREIPAFGESVSEVTLEADETPTFQRGDISVLIPPQPVPDFIDTVFGEILGLGYQLDPSVAGRQEIVTYRSPPNVSRDKLYASAQATLLSYGIAITYDEGEVRAVLKDELLRQAPRFIRSRARGSVPGNLRPIAQYVEITASSVSVITSVLNEVFPNRNELKITGLNQFNAMILTGLPETIERAERVIAEMDEIRLARTRVATIQIENWDISELTTIIERQFTIEGFSITSSSSSVRSINLFPIEFTKQLVIFAQDQEILEYAVATVERLDKSAEITNDLRAYVYRAQYYEAAKLAKIITGQSAGLSNPSNSSGAQNVGAPLQPSNLPNTNGLGDEGNAFDVNFTVDEQGNRLIYMASEAQHREISSLLRVLDTPQDEVLIEVTIAEVSLTDDTKYGLDFLMSQLGSQGYSISAGTSGRIGLATGGLFGRYSSGDYIVNFSALSSNNQINVLSSPRLVVKSGAVGSIQVGTDVPIITSQAASNNQIGGNTDILQSVEYRETGILLDIEPLVLSDDRIDIKVSQEVSAAEDNANQAIASPIISNRQIQTELTLQDGQSAILGGLIENRYTRGTTGVPVVKDLPLVGNLFKTETLNSRRTMLLVMITPYVLSNRDDREISVNRLTDVMNEAFENQVNDSVTLIKPETAFGIDKE